MYIVELIRAAERDFANLDHSLRILAAKQLHKLRQRPQAGESLGNKFGYDLSGYRSIYFARKKYRIIYRLDEAAERVTVVAIGKKANFAVYRQAARRIQGDKERAGRRVNKP
jgi:mRNA interferase RelE/StbE